MKTIKLRSPAKVNLYLRVLKKRPDGFHNIKTVFERIDLYDNLTFTSNQTGKISISCHHPQIPIGPKNLIYKVALALQEKYKIRQGVRVHLNKRIPVAAGLAGGSSNAATTILALNRLWRLGLSKAEMVKLGQNIGSDVAFFLHDTSFALGTQRGDHIIKINIKPKYWHILVVVKHKMYAKEVYGAFKLSLTKKRDNVNILIHNLRNSNMLGVCEHLTNDLEKPVLRLKPGLETLKKRLKLLNSKGVMISGSGPSVFGLVASKTEANAMKKILKRRYSQVFVVRTL